MTNVRLTEDQEREVAEAYARRMQLVLVSERTLAGMRETIRTEPKKAPPCEGANDCGWEGIVVIRSADDETAQAYGSSWRACREHAAPFRAMRGYVVIDAGRENRRTK